MRILPVLDLKHGVVVRGVGGRRDEYRPIKSRLTASAQPLDVARAFRDHFGFNELYLADLDAIAGSAPALSLFRDLLGNDFRLWIDAGLGHMALLASAGAHTLIAGLESISGPTVLHDIVQTYSASRVVFSLDLNNGMALGHTDTWASANPWDIARQAIEIGVARILVLDLADVGEAAGTRTLDLCERLRRSYPNLEITTGGGIRGVDDLKRLADKRVDNALVASALHDGRLTPKDVASFT
jgi:phosphoribosylformimino-5-aminoimidazole carboxamide ribotide isomerase